MRKVISRNSSRRKALLACPIIALGVLGLASQNYYVEESRGTGTGFVHIPDGSSSKIIEQLKRVAKATDTPGVVVDSSNVVLIKLMGVYFKGLRSAFPARDFLSNFWALGDASGPELRKKAAVFIYKHKALLSQERFDWQDGGSRDSFHYDRVGLPPGVPPEQISVIVEGASQTLLNRRHLKFAPGVDVVKRRWNELRNHLIFIESDRGKTYWNPDRRITSIFPLEPDPYWKGGKMAGVTRYMMFAVVNPSQPARFVLDLSAAYKDDGECNLPWAAAAVGEGRAPFPLIGRGSARAVSPPIMPQMVGGRAYIAIDLGEDGKAFPSHATWLMKTYGSDIPMDYRRLVGYVHEISLLSEQDYTRLNSPDHIAMFPADLRNPDLEYSGIYDDGWAAERASVTLSQPAEFAPFIVRGVMPPTGSGAARRKLVLLMDGEEIRQSELDPGEFDLRIALPDRPGRHRFELRLPDAHWLSGADHRKGSVLLQFVGFRRRGQEGHEEKDIVEGDAGVDLLNGWYPFEAAGGTSFRWAENDAELCVASAATRSRDLTLDIEPGPGIAERPLGLRVLNASGQSLLTRDLHGRELLNLKVPVQDGGRCSIVRLHVDGRGTPGRGDTRILNFRVFRVGSGEDGAAAGPRSPGGAGVAAAPDIVTPGDGVQLAEGWYAAEKYRGELFRWINNDARFTVSAPAGDARPLQMELEPGPGAGGKPLIVKIEDGRGRQVQALEARTRETVNLFLSAGSDKASVFRIHIEGGGNKIPGEPRILNLRLFKLRHTAPETARDITVGAEVKLGGGGWYPLETFEGETFRWVSNDAVFAIASSAAGNVKVRVELQEGPGTEGKFALKVLDEAGRQVREVRVRGRKTLDLLLPLTRGGESHFRFHVDGGGKPARDDPRTLNFRVFKMGLAR